MEFYSWLLGFVGKVLGTELRRKRKTEDLCRALKEELGWNYDILKKMENAEVEVKNLSSRGVSPTKEELLWHKENYPVHEHLKTNARKQEGINLSKYSPEEFKKYQIVYDVLERLIRHSKEAEGGFKINMAKQELIKGGMIAREKKEFFEKCDKNFPNLCK